MKLQHLCRPEVETITIGTFMSGSDCIRCAFGEAKRVFCKHFQLDFRYHFVFACECDEVCQNFIRGQKDRPDYVFRNASEMSSSHAWDVLSNDWVIVPHVRFLIVSVECGTVSSNNRVGRIVSPISTATGTTGTTFNLFYMYIEKHTPDVILL